MTDVFLLPDLQCCPERRIFSTPHGFLRSNAFGIIAALHLRARHTVVSQLDAQQLHMENLTASLPLFATQFVTET